MKQKKTSNQTKKTDWFSEKDAHIAEIMEHAMNMNTKDKKIEKTIDLQEIIAKLIDKDIPFEIEFKENGEIILRTQPNYLTVSNIDWNGDFFYKMPDGNSI